MPKAPILKKKVDKKTRFSENDVFIEKSVYDNRFRLSDVLTWMRVAKTRIISRRVLRWYFDNLGRRCLCIMD